MRQEEDPSKSGFMPKELDLGFQEYKANLVLSEFYTIEVVRGVAFLSQNDKKLSEKFDSDNTVRGQIYTDSGIFVEIYDKNNSAIDRLNKTYEALSSMTGLSAAELKDFRDVRDASHGIGKVQGPVSANEIIDLAKRMATVKTDQKNDRKRREILRQNIEHVLKINFPEWTNIIKFPIP